MSESVTIAGVDSGSKSVTLTAAHVSTAIPPNVFSAGTEFDILASRWLPNATFAAWWKIAALIWNGSPSDLVVTTTLPSYGGWLFQATVPVAGYVSNLLYLPVLDGSLSAFSLGKTAIVETIKRLELEDIGERVYDQILADERLITYPCVYVIEDEGVESVDEGFQPTNDTDNITYVVKVLIANRKNILTPNVREWYRKRRQIVRRAFHKQRLANMPGSIITAVEHSTAWQQMVYPDNQGTTPAGYDLLATVLKVKFTVREFRGFLV